MIGMPDRMSCIKCVDWKRAVTQGEEDKPESAEESDRSEDDEWGVDDGLNSMGQQNFY